MRYLRDVNDGAIGGSDKHWPVVINVYDCDNEIRSSPEGWATLVGGDDGQVEPLRRLKQTARSYQPRVWIQGESV